MGFSKSGVAQSLGSVQVPIDPQTPKPANSKNIKDNSSQPSKTTNK